MRQRDGLWSWLWVKVFPSPTGCRAMANSWAPLGLGQSLVQKYVVRRSGVEIHWMTHMIPFQFQKRNSSETGRLCSTIMAISNWNGTGPLSFSCSSSSLGDARLFNLYVETETADERIFYSSTFQKQNGSCLWRFVDGFFFAPPLADAGFLVAPLFGFKSCGMSSSLSNPSSPSSSSRLPSNGTWSWSTSSSSSSSSSLRFLVVFFVLVSVGLVCFSFFDPFFSSFFRVSFCVFLAVFGSSPEESEATRGGSVCKRDGTLPATENNWDDPST